MRALGAQVLFLRHPDYILLPSGGPDRIDEALGVSGKHLSWTKSSQGP